MSSAPALIKAGPASIYAYTKALVAREQQGEDVSEQEEQEELIKRVEAGGLRQDLKHLKQLSAVQGEDADEVLDGITGAMINVALIDQSAASPSFVDKVARHALPPLIDYCSTTAKQYTKQDTLSASRVQSISSTVRTLTLVMQNLYPAKQQAAYIQSPERSQTMRPLGGLKFLQSLVHLIPMSRSVYCQLDIVEFCINLCKRDAGTSKNRLMQALGQNNSFNKQVGERFKELLALNNNNIREGLTNFVRDLHTDCMPAELRINIFDVVANVGGEETDFEATAMMTEQSLLVSNGLLSPEAESIDRTYAMRDITAVEVQDECVLVTQYTDPESQQNNDSIRLIFHNEQTCLLAARYLSSHCSSLPNGQSHTGGARPPSTSPSFRAFGSTSKKSPLRVDVVASTTTRDDAPDIAIIDSQQQHKVVKFEDEVQEVTSMSLGDFSKELDSSGEEDKQSRGMQIDNKHQEPEHKSQDEECGEAGEEESAFTQSWTPDEISVTNDGQDIETMTCQRLRAALLELGAMTKGRKAQLQQRLREILCDQANEAEKQRQKQNLTVTESTSRCQDMETDDGHKVQDNDEILRAEGVTNIEEEQSQGYLQAEQHGEQVLEGQQGDAAREEEQEEDQGGYEELEGMQQSTTRNAAAVSQMRALLSSLDPAEEDQQQQKQHEEGEGEGEGDAAIEDMQEVKEIAKEGPPPPVLLSKEAAKPKSPQHAVFGALEDSESSEPEVEATASQQAWQPQKKKTAPSPLVRRPKTTRAAAKAANAQLLTEVTLDLESAEEDDKNGSQEEEQHEDSMVASSESESEAEVAVTTASVMQQLNSDDSSSDEEEDDDDVHNQETNSADTSPMESSVRQLTFSDDESSEDDDDDTSDNNVLSEEDSDDSTHEVNDHIKVETESLSPKGDLATIEQFKTIGKKHQKKQQQEAFSCVSTVSQRLDATAKIEQMRIKKLRKQLITPIAKRLQKSSKKLNAAQVKLRTVYAAYEAAHNAEMTLLRQEASAVSSLRAELGVNEPIVAPTDQFENLLAVEHNKLLLIGKSNVRKTSKHGEDMYSKMAAMFAGAAN